jgi:5-methyltetrahydrofolate--homocysteine methyltransferase
MTGTRDFQANTRERVGVFDGGMGATLKMFDLSLDEDYRPPAAARRCSCSLG